MDAHNDDSYQPISVLLDCSDRCRCWCPDRIDFGPAAGGMPQWQVLRSIEDFGGLRVYAAENAALPAAPANRVVFLGDSITQLWGEKASFFPGEPYLNRGIAGQTTAQMLIRFRQDVIDLRPAVVVIQGGLADIAGFAGPSSLVQIENNLRSMAELASFNHIRRFSWGNRRRRIFRGARARSP